MTKGEKGLFHGRRLPTWKRLGAFVIDYALFWIATFLVALPLYHFTDGKITILPMGPILHETQGRVYSVQDGAFTRVGNFQVKETVTIEKTTYFWVFDQFRLVRDVVKRPVSGGKVETVRKVFSGKADDTLGNFQQEFRWFDTVSPLVVFLVLVSFLESSKWFASPGKKILGLRVCTRDGRRQSFARSFARNLLKIPSVALLGAGCLSIFFSGKRQAVHDMILKCLVVDIRRGRRPEPAEASEA